MINKTNGTCSYSSSKLERKNNIFLFRDIFRGQRALHMNMNGNKYPENYKCTKEIFISCCQILRLDMSKRNIIFVTNNVGPNQGFFV